MCEELVRNTSDTLWPLVTFRTILKGKVICFHENFRDLVVLFSEIPNRTRSYNNDNNNNNNNEVKV